MTVDEVSLMRREEVLQAFRLSKSTMYHLIEQGLFPGPVRIGPRSVRWRQSDVVTWLTARPLASEVEYRA